MKGRIQAKSVAEGCNNNDHVAKSQWMHIEASSWVIFKIIQVLIYKNSNDFETNKKPEFTSPGTKIWRHDPTKQSHASGSLKWDGLDVGWGSFFANSGSQRSPKCHFFPEKSRFFQNLPLNELWPKNRHFGPNPQGMDQKRLPNCYQSHTIGHPKTSKSAIILKNLPI